jgi:hypothetical protein
LIGAGAGGGAEVFVVSVRSTVCEPSVCLTVVSLMSELVVSPVSELVVVWVRVVVVDFGGGGLLPQAANPSAETSRNAVVVKLVDRLRMLSRHLVQGRAQAPRGATTAQQLVVARFAG